MEESQNNKAQPPLIDKILQYGKHAFDPELPEQTRRSNVPNFDDLLKRLVKLIKLQISPLKRY